MSSILDEIYFLTFFKLSLGDPIKIEFRKVWENIKLLKVLNTICCIGKVRKLKHPQIYFNVPARAHNRLNAAWLSKQLRRYFKCN